MKIRRNYITEILNNKNWRSILIAGPWGCGKSYLVNEFLKKNDNISYNYISLFGIENGQEFLAILKESMNPNDFYSIENSYFLNNDLKMLNDAYELDSNSPIFIFDDIERINTTKFSFDTFFGIAKKLVSLGYRVICILANNKTQLSPSFEKSIDRICVIREPSDEVIKTLAGKHNNLDCDKIRKITYCNLRILIRTRDNFESIVKKLRKTNKNYLNKLGITRESLFLILLCVFTAIESVDYSNKSALIKNDYQKIVYDRDVTNFGFNIANEFLRFKKENVLNDFESDLVIELADYILTGSELIFASLKEKDKNSILDYQYTFLSDSKKNLYIKEFLKKINSFDFTVDQNLGILASILRNPEFYDFNDNELTLIANKLLKDFGESDKINDIFAYRFLGGNINNNFSNFDHLKYVMEEIKKTKYLKKDEKTKTKRKNYELMIKNIEKMIGKSENIVIPFVQELALRNYDFPEINYTISASKWKYCHLLCKLISESNDEERKKFINFLCKKRERTNTKSGWYRFSILLNEYFNKL